MRERTPCRRRPFPAMHGAPFTLGLLAVVFGAAPGFAQDNAVASLTASVQQPITVTKNKNLSFGSVFPGVDQRVPVTATGAGKFTVAGQASTPVNLTFSLPATIASGAANLAIGSWTGRHNSLDQPSGGTNFTPSASAITATLSALGGLYIFIGATAQPTTTQAAGDYSGTMTMTVVYF
jgi:hypothetical protein